ncbi:hypothetical protein PIB30_070337 [Stylosanthes scabra]|uniref:Uncharacterized protein n=1 Tax=Stylosanthes scabra TaxID=79078 RepID=A0ABU6UQX0_9FABA|nr:hypothetical protein [Stylosanthes scabra]
MALVVYVSMPRMHAVSEKVSRDQLESRIEISEAKLSNLKILTWLNLQQSCAALVEPPPPPPPPSTSTAPPPRPPQPSVKVVALPADRADDLQVEARAMVHASNATLYTPELIASRFKSRHFKVVGRTFQIFSALGTFALKLFIDQRNGTLDQNKRIRAIELRNIFT